MKNNDIDSLLRDSLADYRLSRGERRALKEMLHDDEADDNDLALLRSWAFRIAKEEMIDPQSKQILEWLEGVNKTFLPTSGAATARSYAHFSPGDDCVHAITSLFHQAKQKIDICVFTITDNRISDAIEDAHRRGVQIRVITDNDKSADRGSDIDRLGRSGIPVRTDRTDYHMHHKFAVFDGRRMLTGSYNWTRSAAQYNEENFVVTDDKSLVRAFSQAFETLWKQLG